MPVPRPFACISTEDQWRRAAYNGTALVEGEVMLAWVEQAPLNQPGTAPAPAGLAFDDVCRLYHSVPGEGRVERWLWAAEHRPQAVDLFQAPGDAVYGDFTGAAPPLGLEGPAALAVDGAGRLWVAEPGARRIRIFDLWDRRLVESVATAGTPVDLAHGEDGVLALVATAPSRSRLGNSASASEPRASASGVSPPTLLRFGGRGDPATLPLPPDAALPGRIAVRSGGELFVLDRAGTPQARVVTFRRPPLSVPRATDIEFQPGDTLVVARHPDEDLLRFRVSAAAMEQTASLKGRGYDGRGIVLTPDGRIGFWTARGFRHAVTARISYVPSGRVTGFRLDSGEFHTSWGRLFLDACIPAGSAVRVHCATTDDPPPGPELPRTPPVNLASMEILRPDLSPPMPPASLVPADADIAQELARRGDSGQPWAPTTPAGSFATYECPIAAPPGRFLWITLQLAGDGRTTPRIRAARAERATHDYLRRLPKTYSRDADAAGFLGRYLAMFEGTLGNLEARSAFRHALLDPRGAPESVLPWLAGFVGLLFDERWPAAARRALIEESAFLWRFRGTPAGLSRFLEIYLGVAPVLIEKFRLRGLGGALGDGAPQSNSVLGAGFRVGGAVGGEGFEPLSGTVEDAFATHAHRFTVIVPRALAAAQLDVVRHILDVHRPAHTIYDVCTAGAGMRAGLALYAGLTSVIGPGGGFRTLQVEASLLGRDAVLGRPRAGYGIAASRLGEDAVVG